MKSLTRKKDAMRIDISGISIAFRYSKLKNKYTKGVKMDKPSK